jgi:hypothetical protein
MRKIQILGLVLFAAFAGSAVIAASAFAESEWLINGVAPAAAVNTKGPKADLKLKDDATGVEVLCEGTSTGTVGGGGAKKDTVVSITVEFATCVVLAGAASCPELTAVAPVNLATPWETEILLVGAEFRDDIFNAAKTTGWLVECKKVPIFGTVDDTCTGNTSTKLTNEAGGKVDAEFEAKSEAAKCSFSNGEGLVTGLTIIETEKAGDSIQVS